MRRAVRAVLGIEGAPHAEVSILLTDDEAVRQMNRDYRGQDRPTDVLSFAQRDAGGAGPTVRPGARNPEILGDVVISVDTARRQAAARGASLEDELAHLAAHGTLHLLGYDDETEPAAEAMRRRERLALASAEQNAGSRNSGRSGRP